MVPDQTGKSSVPCKVAVHVACYEYTMAVCTVDSIGDVSKNFHKFRVIKIICSWVTWKIRVNEENSSTLKGEFCGKKSEILTLYF